MKEVVGSHRVREIKELLAEITKDNPELIDGYLIVSVRIDGGMVIAHNSCCTAHVTNQLIEYMAANPWVNTPNPHYPDGHDQ